MTALLLNFETSNALRCLIRTDSLPLDGPLVISWPVVSNCRGYCLPREFRVEHWTSEIWLALDRQRNAGHGSTWHALTSAWLGTITCYGDKLKVGDLEYKENGHHRTGGGCCLPLGLPRKTWCSRFHSHSLSIFWLLFHSRFVHRLVLFAFN